MNKLKKGAIFSYLYLIVESVLSLVLTPLLVKYLGDSEYGIYGLAATISSYILLLDLGVGNALTRYFSKYKVNEDILSQKKLLGVSLVFYALSSILAVILLFVTIQFSPLLFNKGLTDIEIERAKIMFWIVGANAIVTLLESPFKRMIIAYEQYVLSKVISLLKVIFRFIFILLFLINGGTGFEVLLVNLFLTIIVSIFEAIYVLTKFKITPKIKGVEKAFYKEIFSYSIIIMLQMIAVQINAMVDQVSISILVSSATIYLSIYNVGINLTHYFQNIGGAINSLLMPESVKAIEKKYDSNKILDMMVKFSRVQIIVLGIIYVVFAVCGKDFIYLWVDQSKEYAYYVALIIMFPQIFTLSQSIGTQLLWALNKHKIQAIIQLLVSIANIVLTVVLIKILNPIIGASIGTAISTFLGNVVINAFIYSKELKISILSYYKQQFKGLLSSLLITLIIGLILHNLILINNLIFKFLAICFIMVFIYMILLLLYGFNKSERSLIKKFLSKKENKI